MMPVSKIIAEMERDLDRTNELDARFLTGQISEGEYRKKRENLRKEIARLIDKEKLRTTLHHNWENLK